LYRAIAAKIELFSGEESKMEFFENRPRRPFSGFVLLWRSVRRWHLLAKTRRELRRLSDEQLKDMGLRRSDIS